MCVKSNRHPPAEMSFSEAEEDAIVRGNSFAVDSDSADEVASKVVRDLNERFQKLGPSAKQSRTSNDTSSASASRSATGSASVEMSSTNNVDAIIKPDGFAHRTLKRSLSDASKVSRVRPVIQHQPRQSAIPPSQPAIQKAYSAGCLEAGYPAVIQCKL